MTVEEKDGLPVVDAQTPEKEQPTLPDDPVTEVERIKAEHAETLKQAEALKAEKEQLEKRLKDNQEYISRTRNVEKATEPAKPQRTLDDYLEEVSKKFEDDPKEGLKKVIRDIAYDRDLERETYAKQVAEAEDRAFKKMLALNPESSKMLKEIEKLDAECPDLQGLSYERKVEYINLRNSAATRQEGDARSKAGREAALAGAVGSSGLRGGKERIPSWVNDPEVVKNASGKFATKQELLNWADSDKAREMYERRLAQQQ